MFKCHIVIMNFLFNRLQNHYIASSNINNILWTSLLHDIDNLEKTENADFTINICI
jgi:hypothetical protein